MVVVGWGSKHKGIEPAFRLDCPGCEQQTVWVDVSHNRYVSIEFIPIPAGTGHVVMCSECGLSMAIGETDLSSLRALTMARSGVPLEECAGDGYQTMGMEWLEAREKRFLAKLRRTVHPLNSECLQLMGAGVPEEAITHLKSGDDDERRARVILDLVAGSEAELVAPLSGLVSKLDPDTRRYLVKQIAKTGDWRHLPLLEGIRCDDSRRTAKVVSKAISQLQQTTT